MKKLPRIIHRSSLALVFSLILAVSISAQELVISQEEDFVTPSSSSSTFLSISSSGLATVSSQFSGDDDVTVIYSQVALQRERNGTWENVYSKNQNLHSNYSATNYSYQVTSGYYYQVRAIYTVYSDNDTLTYTYYSYTAYY